MTIYQIISIVISLIAMFSGGVAAYIKLKTDLAKIQAEIEELQQGRRRNKMEIDCKLDKEMFANHQLEIYKKLESIDNQTNIIIKKLISG